MSLVCLTQQRERQPEKYVSGRLVSQGKKRFLRELRRDEEGCGEVGRGEKGRRRKGWGEMGELKGGDREMGVGEGRKGERLIFLAVSW